VVGGAGGEILEGQAEAGERRAQMVAGVDPDERAGDRRVVLYGSLTTLRQRIVAARLALTAESAPV
jgi:hypothetical protein